MIQFKPAVRHAAKLRLALSGPSGAGKTYSALQLAAGLGGKVAVIDTEMGSASLYAHLTPFDVLELGPPYEPGRYQEALAAAEAAGYDVVIIDSLSHEWSGVGGCLELVDKYAAVTRNSYTAWGQVTPKHQALLDAIQRAKCHVIATLRSKADYVLEDSGGKKVPRKVGLAPIQRDGIEYEWTVVLDIAVSNHAVASKDRTGLFTGATPFVIAPEHGARLASWLAAGEAQEPAPQSDPSPAPAASQAPAQPATDAVTSFLWLIEASESKEDLQTVRANAHEWAKQARDTEAWAEIDRASRARLATLAKQTLPPTSTTQPEAA